MRTRLDPRVAPQRREPARGCRRHRPGDHRREPLGTLPLQRSLAVAHRTRRNDRGTRSAGAKAADHPRDAAR